MSFKLVIARHGEAGWDNEDGKDINRSLTVIGQANSVRVGSEFEKQFGKPDLIISSTAKRAEMTSKLIIEGMSYSDELQFESMFYSVGVVEMMTFINSLSDQNKFVLFVGHNPVWSDLINNLTGTYAVGLSTSELAVIEFDVESWAEVSGGSGIAKYVGKFND